MTHQLTQIATQRIPGIAPILEVAPDMSRVCILRRENETEVLAFLAVRPVHTVVMTSFIKDNGIESELNRGIFYGFRSLCGDLEGVALIGHSTLFETRTREATHALAIAARRSETAIHLVMSGGSAAETFWRYFRGNLEQPRLTCTEELFELRFPFLVKPCKWDVRYASMGELDQIAEAQAEIAFIESGVDPRLTNREAFLERVARRIAQNRVFVVVDDEGKLLFKADVVAQTDETAYLEGVYVHKDFRGLGMGSNCLADVSRRLLGEVQNICLLSNVEMKYAHRSFLKAGFRNTDRCVTLFV